MIAQEEIYNPEIVIGIVGPIGVDLDAIIKYITTSLDKVNYSSSVIHLTSLLREYKSDIKIDETSYSSKYHSLIKESDNFCKERKNNSALVGLAISKIRLLRQTINIDRARSNTQKSNDEIDVLIKNAQTLPAYGTAYIIRQLKRQDEISTLRAVYGRKFVQISVYLHEDDRKKNLKEKIKDYKFNARSDSEAEREASRLIEIDYNESDNVYGQRISDIFHLGDVFVYGNSSDSTEKTVNGFIRALFGFNGCSPTKSEYGMYTAAAAALRSMDLSRQVGAAVFSEDGDIITLGCNEVPKPFGGAYWCDDPGQPLRDFERGNDPNHKQNLALFHDILYALDSNGYIKKSKKQSIDSLFEILKDENFVKKSKLMDIIEFGRIIHAEMSAITDASRLGRSTKDAVLFCTTFPCHMCAKHIVSSGIKKVVFLEPYPKSHAKYLHEDAITFSKDEQKSKVLFEPFIGISPRRYRDIFERKKRKDESGKSVDWYRGMPTPLIEDKSAAYIANEQPIISILVAD